VTVERECRSIFVFAGRTNQRARRVRSADSPHAARVPCEHAHRTGRGLKAPPTFIRAHLWNPWLNFPHMSKVYSDPTAALDGLLHDNMTIAAGGFGLCGIPENLIAALHDSGVKGAHAGGKESPRTGKDLLFANHR